MRGSTLSEGYLLVNTSSGPGAGIVGQTMQFHGTADRYTLGERLQLWRRSIRTRRLPPSTRR